ncbi:MAG: transcription antitermination factor NusB [Eggerthellaceae bacterium]
MARKHERSLARCMAVQALYQSEITGTDLSEMAGNTTIIPDGGALPEYAVSLLAAIKDHAEEIDDRISEASENWSLSRMPIVDRAILRASVCEIYFIDDVPVSVSINEAVELAKEFGGEDESSRFVNGILGRIARTMDSEAEAIWSEEDSDAVPEAAVAAEDRADAEAECAAQSDEAGAMCVPEAEEGVQECQRPVVPDADAVDGQ